VPNWLQEKVTKYFGIRIPSGAQFIRRFFSRTVQFWASAFIVLQVLLQARKGDKVFASRSTRTKKLATTILIVLSSVLGMQSSFASYYPSGIQQNVSEQTLRDNGWKLFYQEFYGTPIGNSTTLIRPSGQYVILSGKAAESSTIMLLAAAPTKDVFTETIINTPQLINGTYWYYTLTFIQNFGSIGFAPTNVIMQSSADVVDRGVDPLRLSWHLDDWPGGGYRLGTLNLNGSTNYVKQVWTWDGPAAPALRQTSNLSFDQSQYGSDTLSDPDGQLRKTIDSINAKYGNLLK